MKEGRKSNNASQKACIILNVPQMPSYAFLFNLVKPQEIFTAWVGTS